MDLETRFAVLWSNLQLPGSPAPAWRLIVAFYGQKHRDYHNLSHIEHALTVLDRLVAARLKLTAHLLWAVELAIFFHDVVYAPLLHDNEDRSIDVMDALCFAEPDTDITRDMAKSFIEATKKHTVVGPFADGCKAMLDCDLAILGARPEVFRVYDAAIRREYAHVPADDYADKRIAVLQGFLDRERLFYTEAAHALFDLQARVNLRWAINHTTRHLDISRLTPTLKSA